MRCAFAMRCATAAARTTLSCLHVPLCHAASTPLSCCAQSQHPAMSVERFKPGVPGFRDYARNDSVEATTPCSAHSRCGAHHPVMFAGTTVSCGAYPCHAARSRSIQRLVEHSKPGVPGFRDYARNDSVETTTPRSARALSCLHVPLCHAAPTPVMLRAVAASRGP